MDNWRAEISDELEKLVDRAVTAGARQDVFAEVKKVIRELEAAVEQYPDPPDAPSETIADEPANEWPGAER